MTALTPLVVLDGINLDVEAGATYVTTQRAASSTSTRRDSVRPTGPQLVVNPT